MGRIVATVACLFALLALAAAAAAKVIGSGDSTGPHATAVATADASNRHTLSIRVLASPAQLVQVNWDAICSHSLSPRTVSGKFSARAPFTRTIRTPLAVGTSCIASAEAALSSSGVLIVEILSS